jgi:hypothetical protein
MIPSPLTICGKNEDLVVIRHEFRKPFVEKDHLIGRVNQPSELDFILARSLTEDAAIWAPTLSDVFLSRKPISIVSDADRWSLGDELHPFSSELNINCTAQRASWHWGRIWPVLLNVSAAEFWNV